MGRVSARTRLNLLWVVLNFTLGGLSSWTIRPLWPLVFLSWNSRTRRWTVDLPGPFKWTSDPTSRRP
jgi:hypothetical protein